MKRRASVSQALAMILWTGLVFAAAEALVRDAALPARLVMPAAVVVAALLPLILVVRSRAGGAARA